MVEQPMRLKFLYFWYYLTLLTLVASVYATVYYLIAWKLMWVGEFLFFACLNWYCCNFYGDVIAKKIDNQIAEKEKNEQNKYDKRSAKTNK